MFADQNEWNNFMKYINDAISLNDLKESSVVKDDEMNKIIKNAQNIINKRIKNAWIVYNNTKNKEYDINLE